MRRAAFSLIVCLLSEPTVAQNAADEFYDPGEMAAARAALHQSHGGQINYLVLAEQFEWLDDDELGWEAQGWVGGDEHKLWLKTEGAADDDAALEAVEWQALYSRAIHPFWDIQAGLRVDAEPGPTRTFATLGVQGLAPYWFEIDAALFISDDGDLSARAEIEYELLLTQRLILQPKLEIDAAVNDDVETGVYRGINSVEAGLRLRYEWRREFAPYVGILHESAIGNARRTFNATGRQTSETVYVLGLRAWW
ncbi:MAG: copper resistance protein B [Pseudomonadota bacterium]